MDIERLRSKGWTEEEIDHMREVFSRAERTGYRRLEHLAFWICLIVLAAGVVAVMLELLPLLLLASTSLAAPVVFLLAACLGLFLVHVLHDLKLERTHQHVGVATLAAVSFLLVMLVINTLETRFGDLGFSLIYGGLVALGFIVPYIAHWRILHEPQ